MAVVPDTTLTAEALRKRLGGGSGTTLEDAEALLAEAAGLVADVFKDAHRDVPQWAVDLVVFRTARGLRDGNKASTGAGQVGVEGAVPLRSPADPMKSSYPIMRRYVVMGV